MTFQEMIEHPEWQKKRLRIMNREHFTCQACGANQIQLHVHHLRYPIRGGFLWDVPDEQLECLCKICHQMRTEWNRVAKTAIESTPTRGLFDEAYRVDYIDYNGQEKAA